MAETMPIRRAEKTEAPPTQEEMELSFRNSLEDAVALVGALGKSCPATSDLIEVLKIGLDSDSQLRFLMGLLQTIPAEKKR